MAIEAIKVSVVRVNMQMDSRVTEDAGLKSEVNFDLCGH